MTNNRKTKQTEDEKLRRMAENIFTRMTNIDYPFFEATLFRIAFRDVNLSAEARSNIIEKLKEISLLRSFYNLGLRQNVESFKFDKKALEEKSCEIQRIIFEGIKKSAEKIGKF